MKIPGIARDSLEDSVYKKNKKRLMIRQKAKENRQKIRQKI